MKDLNTDLPGRYDGRLSVRLMDKLQFIISGDYGADHESLSAKHLKLLADANIFVVVLPLSEPKELRL